MPGADVTSEVALAKQAQVLCDASLATYDMKKNVCESEIISRH